MGTSVSLELTSDATTAGDYCEIVWEEPLFLYIEPDIWLVTNQGVDTRTDASV
jgi:hypothetical protein